MAAGPVPRCLRPTRHGLAGPGALLLALINGGNVVLPLTSSAEARKPDLHGIAQVQSVFRFGPRDEWECASREVRVTNPLILRLTEAGEPGLVLFSSGSTGEPKAALHSFARLLEKFKGQRHSLRTIAFLVLDHIGGINTLFYILSNTGVVIATGDRDPDSVCCAVERHRAEMLPTSPTFLKLLLLSEAHTRYDLSSLRQITYGSEPMPESTLRRIHELFPRVKILQTYGLSELGILRSKSRASDSLWVRIGGDGFETKVVDGILWIRAESAMLGYLNAPDPFDAEGWLNTGDEVEADGDYVRILGRRSELINVGGEKVHPAEIEGVLMEMENIRDATVRGQPNSITGQMVVARVSLAEPEDPHALRGRMFSHCSRRLARFKIPSKIEIANDQQHTYRFKKTRRVEGEPGPSGDEGPCALSPARSPA